VDRHSPKWATPDRKCQLVAVFIRSRGFCVFGHKGCLIPEHHYQIYIETLIRDWIADDRAQSVAERQAERKLLHSQADRRYPVAGQFNAVSRDIFFAQQPDYYFIGLGMSGLTFKPFAKLRLPSSYLNLFVDLGDTLKAVSKSKRRKAIRYGKALPIEIQRQVDRLCNLAVRHYLANSAR
jgi:hypothetical protein